MDKKTLKALDASIRHWQRMASGNRRKMRIGGRMTLEEPVADCCSLCRSNDGCEKCIITKEGFYGCADTPFDDAYDLYINDKIDSPEFKEAAQHEVDFLVEIKNKYIAGKLGGINCE